MAKKQPGKALVKWEEEFANFAKESTKGIKIQEGKFISFKSGQMKFAGADIPNNEIRCVIVGWCHANAYYEPGVRFDPKNPQSPICYAFGEDESEMEPHDDAPDKQSDSCAGCPFNEFGSADNNRGPGKACKNTIRLALIAESDLENMDEAEVVYASIAPTSIKNWAVYAKKTLGDKLRRPFWSVVTNMALVADDEDQFKVTFEHMENIEDSDLFGPLKDLYLETNKGIGFPYQVFENPAPMKKGKGKAAAKPAAKKFGKR